jgi:transcription elongation GreA/GreB family factor
MKKNVFLGAMLGMVSAFGMFAFGCSRDKIVKEAEPNDTWDKAQLITVGTKVTGKVQSGGDEDLYKIVLSEPGTLSIYPESKLDITDFVICYENEDGELYGSFVSYDNLDMFFQDNEGKWVVRDLVSEGTYGIFVSAFQEGPNTEEPYTFITTFEASGSSTVKEAEPNDTWDKAQLIKVGTKVTGEVQSDGDEDYYKIVLSEPGTLSVFHESKLKMGNFAVFSEDEDGKMDYSITSFGKWLQDDEGVWELRDSVSKGTYGIKVTPDEKGPYTLITSFEASGSSASAKKSDNKANAQTGGGSAASGGSKSGAVSDTPKREANGQYRIGSKVQVYDGSGKPTDDYFTYSPGKLNLGYSTIDNAVILNRSLDSYSYAALFFWKSNEKDNIGYVRNCIDKSIEWAATAKKNNVRSLTKDIPDDGYDLDDSTVALTYSPSNSSNFVPAYLLFTFYIGDLFENGKEETWLVMRYLTDSEVQSMGQGGQGHFVIFHENDFAHLKEMFSESYLAEINNQEAAWQKTLAEQDTLFK